MRDCKGRYVRLCEEPRNAIEDRSIDYTFVSITYPFSEGVLTKNLMRRVEGNVQSTEDVTDLVRRISPVILKISRIAVEECLKVPAILS